jgi:hypothetical protein
MPGFIVHSDVELAAHPQSTGNKKFEVVLYHCERNDACVRNRADGQHRKIADVATWAGSAGSRPASCRDCVFIGKERLIPLHESSAGVTFAVKVHPRGKKNAITGEVGDALKVSLTAPPVDGKANAACIEFFAKLLKVPCSSVTIASGQSSRRKVIRVSGLSAEQVRKCMADGF